MGVYRGVYRTSWGTRWFASIKVAGVTRYLGTFPSPEAAARAYDMVAAANHGERAVLNFPLEHQDGDAS